MTETAHAVPVFTLGDRLAKALDHSGVSVQEMADYLEVSRNTIGNYTSGRSKVPAAVILAWSQRTGVPVAWLRYGVLDGGDPDPGRESGNDTNAKLAELTAKKARRGSGHAGASGTHRYPVAA